MKYLVRSDGLSGYEALVGELGGDPANLLEQAGLDPTVARTPNIFLSHRRFNRAFELAATTLGCPDFGLRLGSRQTHDILGPIALALENERFLADAVNCVARYIHAHDTAIRLTLNPQKGSSNWLWAFDLRPLGTTSLVQHRELGLVLGSNTFKLLSDGLWQPTEIWFEHPPLSPPEVYAQYFGCPLLFSAPLSGIVLHESDLALPIHARNADLGKAAHEYLVSHYGAGELSLSERVRALMRPLLETGRCSNEALAQRFAMHPRTLRRHLLREGTTFEDIKDAARRDWAAELLRQRMLSVTQIAFILGYANASALDRSCLRWFGKSPRALRRAGEQ